MNQPISRYAGRVGTIVATMCLIGTTGVGVARADTAHCTQSGVGVGGLDTLKACVVESSLIIGGKAQAYATATYYTSCGRAGHNVTLMIDFTGPFGSENETVGFTQFVGSCASYGVTSSYHDNPSGAQAWAAVGHDGACCANADRAPTTGYYSL